MGLERIRTNLADEPFDVSNLIATDMDASEIQLLLLGISSRIRNDRNSYHRKVANIARKCFRQNFALGGQPPWKPLRPSTVAAKANLAQFPAVLGKKSGRIPSRLKQNGSFGPSSILIMTGALRDSVSVLSNPNNITEFRADGMTLGSSLIYAATQNYGATIVPKTKKVLRWFGADGKPVFARQSVIPARPFLTLTDEALANIEHVGVDWFMGQSNADSAG